MKEVYSATRPLDPIFSDQEWKEMYPAKEYKEYTPRVKNLLVHFLLGLNQPDDTIVKQIQQKASGKFCSKLTLPDAKNHGLTLLHMAVMRNKIDVLRALLVIPEVRKTINARDAWGWTPLHHSVFSSKAIFQLLKKNGANLEAKTALGGTVEDLQRLKSGVIKAKSLDSLYYEERGKVVHWASMTNRTCLGILQYSDNLLLTEDGLQVFWQQQDEKRTCPITKCSESIMIEIIQSSRPVKLVIAPCKELQNTLHPHQKELRALEKLPFKTIIGPYSGEYFKEASLGLFRKTSDEKIIREQATYCFAPCSARRIGNYTRFMNNGWPNLLPIEVVNEGQRLVYFVVTDKQGIEAGSPLLYDYGPNYFGNLETTHIFRRDEMRAFFEQGFEPIFSKREELSHKYLSEFKSQKDCFFSSMLEYFSVQSKLTTPLGSPTALLDLHYSKISPINSWISLIEANIQFQDWMHTFPDVLLRNKAIAREVNALDSLIASDEELQEPIYSWVLERLGRQPIMNVVKGIQLITNQLKINKLIHDYLPCLDGILSEYRWKEDPESAINFKCMLESQTEYYRECLKRGSRNDVQRLYQACLKVVGDAIDDEERRYHTEICEMIKREFLDSGD